MGTHRILLVAATVLLCGSNVYASPLKKTPLLKKKLLTVRGGATATPATPTATSSAMKLKGGAAAKRVRPAPGANSPTGSIVSLVKNIVGAGMLALPAGMAAGGGTGLIPATAIVLSCCLMSAYTFSLVGRACEETGAHDFRDLWGETLGEHTSWIVDFMILGVAGGALLIYGCFLGDMLTQLTNDYFSRTGAIVLCGLVLLPLALMPDLSSLAPVSVVGVGAIIYSAVFIIYRAVDGSYKEGGALLAETALKPAFDTLSNTRVSVGSTLLFNCLLTAFMGHTNAVRFYNELQDRTPERFAGVVNFSFLASAAVYLVVMLAGYFTFGSVSTVPILSNYATTDMLCFFARLATFVSIISSHPLLFFSTRDVTISTLKACGFTADFSPSSPRWRLISVVMLTLLTVAAVVTSDVGFVVSLNGALFGSGLIFCVPTAVFLSALKKSDPKSALRASTSKKEIGALHLIFAFGVFAALFGTTITCLETFTDILA